MALTSVSPGPFIPAAAAPQLLTQPAAPDAADAAQAPELGMVLAEIVKNAKQGAQGGTTMTRDWATRILYQAYDQLADQGGEISTDTILAAANGKYGDSPLTSMGQYFSNHPDELNALTAGRNGINRTDGFVSHDDLAAVHASDFETLQPHQRIGTAGGAPVLPAGSTMTYAKAMETLEFNFDLLKNNRGVVTYLTLYDAAEGKLGGGKIQEMAQFILGDINTSVFLPRAADPLIDNGHGIPHYADKSFDIGIDDVRAARKKNGLGPDAIDTPDPLAPVPTPPEPAPPAAPVLPPYELVGGD